MSNKSNLHILESVTEIENLRPNSASSQYVKSIHFKSRYNQWVHLNSSYFFQRISYAITIPQILLNSVFAVANIQANGEKSVSYVVTCFLLINAFLVGIKEYLKFDKKVEYHKNLASMYEKLANDIAENLSKDEYDEEIRDIISIYSDLILRNESLPPNRIVQKGKKIFGTVKRNKYSISNFTFGFDNSLAPGSPMSPECHNFSDPVAIPVNNIIHNSPASLDSQIIEEVRRSPSKSVRYTFPPTKSPASPESQIIEEVHVSPSKSVRYTFPPAKSTASFELPIMSENNNRLFPYDHSTNAEDTRIDIESNYY